MIVEIKHELTPDQRNTLLFLTGGLKVIDSQDISEDELWNLKEFFGYNRQNPTKLLRVIIKKDVTITKICK